jgi:hypothetical protein
MFGNKKISMWLRGTAGSTGVIFAAEAGETFLFIMSVGFLISAALLAFSIVLNEP